jgi:hypothetical protein
MYAPVMSADVNIRFPKMKQKKWTCTMVMKRGTTRDAAAPFVKWSKGVKVEGEVTREFPVVGADKKESTAYEISLLKPMKLQGDPNPTKKVSVNGGKAGLRMAINAAGFESLAVGDTVIITCIGESPTNKPNARLDFEIGIDR